MSKHRHVIVHFSSVCRTFLARRSVHVTLSSLCRHVHRWTLIYYGCRYLMDPDMNFVKFFGKNYDAESLADGVITEIKSITKGK